MRYAKYWTLLLLALPVWAADSGVDGLNLQTYASAIDRHGVLNVNGPRLLRAGELSLKLDANMAGGGPFIVNLGGTPIRLLDQVVTANVLAAVGMSRGVTLAVDLPYHTFVQGVNATTGLQYRNHALGDIRLALKFRVLEEKSRRPGVALLLSNTLPTGNTALMTGGTGMVPGVELIAGKTLRYLRLAASVGAQFPRQKVVLGSTFNDRITYGVAAELPIQFLQPGWSVVTTVRGSIDTALSGANGMPVEWLMGVRKHWRNGWDATLAGGGGFDRAIGNPQWRAVASVGYAAALRAPTRRAKPDAAAPRTTCAMPATLQPVTIHWRPGVTHPDAEQRQWLVEFAQHLKRHTPPAAVAVSAHDNAPGAAGLRAAAARAQQVRQILQGEGIPTQQCTIDNRGNSQPLGDGRSTAGATLNRRVTVAPAAQ